MNTIKNEPQNYAHPYVDLITVASLILWKILLALTMLQRRDQDQKMKRLHEEIVMTTTCESQADNKLYEADFNSVYTLSR